MEKLAILMTCYNRKEITLRCLKALESYHLNYDIYLVDDSSTDDTVLEVSANYPDVNIIHGPGNLFWNRGMHLAWKTASSAKDYDYYLWLNDDVVLYEYFFKELIECSMLLNHKAIISGLIQSHDKTSMIYGGYDNNRKLIDSTGSLQSITNLNGNVVLVPRYAYEILGILDPFYHHDLGDVDYGLRAKENNIGTYTTRVAIGSGDSNAPCRVRLWNSTIKERFKKLNTPLGSPPSINFYFRKKHFGLFNALFSSMFIYFINVLPDSVVKKLFGSKYI